MSICEKHYLHGFDADIQANLVPVGNACCQLWSLESHRLKWKFGAYGTWNFSLGS
jgi:hypothetical protein